jgi:hypothetical protein
MCIFCSVLCKQLTIYKTVVLYGCGTCVITLREECRLRISEDRKLRRIFRAKTGSNRMIANYIMRSSIICDLHKIILG